MNDDSSETGILASGDVLNNTYVIQELVASGGTGEVYRAMNRVSGREIAIKILKREFAQDEKFTDLMKREASVLHEVIDPAVVRYYDLLESDMHGGFLFIVMEFIHGQSLADDMKAKGPLPDAVLLKVAERVLQGLQAAHDKKAYHRDLSPDNILLRDGDPEQATLIDFGIAKDVNEGAKTVVGGGFAGKYQYASPEQMEGHTDGRSDLYSLGMTLLGAYRGQAPQAGSSLMEIVKAKAVKPNISDMSGPLHELVSRLVEPEPDDRLQSAAEAQQFLASLSSSPVPASVAPLPDTDKTVVMPRSTPPTAPPVSTPPSQVGAKTAAAERKSRGGLWAVLAVLLLALGGGGAYLAGFFDPGPGPAPDVVAIDGSAPSAPSTDDTPSSPSVDNEETAMVQTPSTPQNSDTPKNPQIDALPFADPFYLTIERTSPADPPKLIGNLPSAQAVPRVTQQLEDGLDAFAVLSDVNPARGEPFDGWSDRIVEVALAFAQLDSFTVSASGTEVILIARANNEAEKSALLSSARQIVDGTDLVIIDRITVAVSEVMLDELTAGLVPFETCGPLQLSGGSGGVVAPDDALQLAGRVAVASDLSRLTAFFRENAPGRDFTPDLTVLNPGVCKLLAEMPAQTTDTLEIAYSFGAKDGTVPEDTFRLGENPVIDVRLPGDRDGYLNVAFVDLAEQVFHLLPHQARTENRLSQIGQVRDGTRAVRVAYPVDEASLQKLGFKVVEPLGTSIVVAIVTDAPLFPETRPRAESNAAYLEALDGRLATIAQDGGLINWRFLVTKP